MPAPRKKTESNAQLATGRAERLDTQMLETLVGYNTRRAWLVIADAFARRMAPFGVRHVDFSVLSLLAHNPGATSRQLCATLDILPPNLVNLIAGIEARGLVERRPHPSDGRAVGLHLTAEGEALVRDAEQAATQLETDASAKLSGRERDQLIKLLQKIYRP